MALVRINFNTVEEGEEYLSRLNDEANRNFQVFLALLSSYWQSTIDGPNYAREIKAMSIAMARIRLALDDVRSDTYYTSLRTDFLYQNLTSVLFPQAAGAPDPQLADVDFRTFLQQIISIYFAGSVPESIQKSVELFVNGTVIVKENFLESRMPASGLDISDEFGFSIDVILASPGATDVFLAQQNIRILLNIIRPAHTLYRLRFILQDIYTGQQGPFQPNKVVDSFTFDLSNYSYEDFRKFVEGVDRIDLLGTKKAVLVTGEDHSMDW
jgi:hypothetical protein